MSAKLVLVEWEDSFGGSGWANASDAHAMMPADTKSIGWLIQESKTHLLLAPHLGYGGSTDGGYTQTCGAIAIPRSCVKRTRTLKEPK
jgi:hypothetical protein